MSITSRPVSGGPWDIYVRLDGSKYVGEGIINGAPRRIVKTDLADIWNWGKALKTDFYMKVGPGSFNTNTITFSANSQCLIGVGLQNTILVLNNGQTNLIQNTHATRTVNNKIWDMTLDGNHSGGGLGYGIDWEDTSGDGPSESMGWWVHIRNIRIKEAASNGLYMKTSTCSSPQCHLENIRAYDSEGSPEILLERIYDSRMACFWTSSVTLAQYCDDCICSDWYVGGGGAQPLIITKCDKLQMSNIKSDNATQNALLIYGGCYGNELELKVSNFQRSGTIGAMSGRDYNGIYVGTGGGNYIRATFYDNDLGSGPFWRYAVRESSLSVGRNWYEIIMPYDLALSGEVCLMSGAVTSSGMIYRAEGTPRVVITV